MKPPVFLLLSRYLGSGALNFYSKCSPCMVPGWHFWHTRSACQRRPRPSSLVANSWRLQQCQPRPLSDCPQRLHRCRCFPNLRLRKMKLSLIEAKDCLPETRPCRPTKLSPSLGRLAGLWTERSTRSSWNQC